MCKMPEVRFFSGSLCPKTPTGTESHTQSRGSQLSDMIDSQDTRRSAQLHDAVLEKVVRLQSAIINRL